MILLNVESLQNNVNYEWLLTKYIFPNYKKNNNILYHNTNLENVDNISKVGLDVTHKRYVTEYEGNMIWATSTGNLKGYGGCTIAFSKTNLKHIEKVNEDEYCIYENIPSSSIKFIDIPLNYEANHTYRLSEVPLLITKYGVEKVVTNLNKFKLTIPIETVIKYIK